jgi:hypothetical protein
MKRKPLILIALVGFWIGYVVISLTYYWVMMADATEKDNLRRLSHVDYQIFMAGPMLATGELESLMENLEEAKKAKEFDFYLLKDQEKVVSFYNPGFTIEQTDRPDFASGTWTSADGKTVARVAKVRGYALVVGINTRGSEYILRALNHQKFIVLREMAVVTLFFLGLLYLVLKDILDLTKILRGRDRNRAELVKVRTKEAETLLAVTTSFEKVTRGLKIANQTYADTISPAVRYELNGDTPTPHLFSAIVVRIDVNGYTQMFLDRKDQFVTQTLNRYFQQASELIGRYGGYIYQFVGDEIVFHFKEHELEHAHQLAVGAVRALFEVAHQIDEELRPEGVPFVVKSSMARGRLRFIRLDTGYAFAGLPLIESVRMLGKIEEREQNILVLYSEDHKALEDFAQAYKRSEVAFKGFSKQSEIVEVKDFTPVTEVLAKKDYARLWFYRSNGEISEILVHLKQNLSKLSKLEFLAIYKALRSCNVQRASGRVMETFSDLFITADSWCGAEPANEFRSMMLAALTNLAMQLLRGGVLNEAVRKRFEKNLAHSDQRIRGNTILTLDELSPETYSFREMFSLPFNRAAADALIAEGRREYTEEIHSFLCDFLKSDDPFFVASGLYVLSFLYDYHRGSDPVYFKANNLLQEVPALIDEHLASQDMMVRRRAQVSRSIVSQGGEDVQIAA